MSNKSSDLDDILAGINPAENKKNGNKGNGNKADSRQPQTVKMGNTLRIPWVYRVKVWVLRGFWALPVFGAYMMIANYNQWETGWKTAMFAVVCYMVHFGCAAMVRFIDPEDWKLVEKDIKSRDITTA